MIRKFFILVSFGALGACGSDTSTGPVTPVAHDPILFVHGYARSSTDWNFMLTRFKASGWSDAELYTINYGFLQSNVTIAEEIKMKVDNILATTTATRVDIVTHSMGGISSRYYIRNLGGAAKVDAWVSIGGPNHGTTTANDCGASPCLEIRIGSSLLAALNSDDETPGAVRYATWWSPVDQIILPNNSVLLTGATNNQTAAIAHLNMVSDLTIANQVRAFVSQ